jgi:hypothetical protein
MEQPMIGDTAKPGRPRLWSDTRTRQRAYQVRQREKLRLIDDLIHAALNAHWEDPQLGRRILKGGDAEILRAITEHYRARHWMRFLPPPARKPRTDKTKGEAVTKPK